MKKPWVRRAPPPAYPPLPQGFEVKVTLRRGDKVVRRTKRGDIEVIRVTTDVAQLDVDGKDRGAA